MTASSGAMDLAIIPAMAEFEQRGKKRERERRARQRRTAKLEQMRFARHILQNTVLAVRTLHEDTWERFLNPDAMRVRRFLLATKQAIALRREQTVLRRLLQEHEVATGVVARMLQGTNDDWGQHIERTHELIQKHYRPRSLQECQIEMDAALREVDKFPWITDDEGKGVQFLGWKERRRVDLAQDLFHFQFAKSFHGYDVMDSVNTSWDAYSDATTFQQVVLGHRLLGMVEILQQLGPNVMVIRVMEKFPGSSGYVHVVYLVFRVRTEKGYTQCVRSLHCPELRAVMEDARDVWPSNLIWNQWEELEGEERGYDLRVGGSFVAQDANYLNKWMMEVFGCVLRAEHLATKRPLIASN